MSFSTLHKHKPCDHTIQLLCLNFKVLIAVRVRTCCLLDLSWTLHVLASGKCWKKYDLSCPQFNLVHKAAFPILMSLQMAAAMEFMSNSSEMICKRKSLVMTWSNWSLISCFQYENNPRDIYSGASDRGSRHSLSLSTFRKTLLLRKTLPLR